MYDRTDTRKFTLFMDMFSGGSQKGDFKYYIVMLPEAQATAWIQRRYGLEVNHITCECCGYDYAVHEYGVNLLQEVLENYVGKGRSNAIIVTLDHIRAQDSKFYESLGRILV